MIDNIERLKKSLKSIWGYEDFRAPQGEIIASLLQGKDSLTVMPTGGGKSLCFQLPALLNTGLTLVISPLIALIENQVQELKQKQLPADFLHSEISQINKKKIFQRIKNQDLRLLYLSPETLLSKPVWEAITPPSIVINGLIIDEAHCLVEWGNTFRPAYTRLGAVRPTLLKFKPHQSQIAIASFTATADEYTQKTIIKTLKLHQPQKFLITPYRSNLQLNVKQIWTPKARKKEVINFLIKKQEKSGLIYLRTRKEAENISHWLNSLGYKNRPYHGGLPSGEKRQIETDWLAEKINFVVSTNAFGMGINKSNVRWILHYQVPLFLSAYIQEIGRGGRDGKPAEVLSLISECTGFFEPTDKNRRNFLLNQTIQQYLKTRRISKKIPLQGNVFSNSNYQLYLSILFSSEQLQWLDPFNYRIKPNNIDYKIKQLINQEKQSVKKMQEYLVTKKCRWAFLLESFGFSISSSFSCGVCDNCVRKKRI